MYNPFDCLDRLNEQALDACERRFLDPDDYDSMDYEEDGEDVPLGHMEDAFTVYEQ